MPNPKPKIEDLPYIPGHSPETLQRFPGMVTLTFIYENFVSECQACELHHTRKRVVFGSGAMEEPPVAFIGDFPDRADEEAGMPFQGTEKDLLDRMLTAMGLSREAVYVLNSVGCRTPGSRNPAKEELAACLPVVHSQLKAVRPKCIVCFGELAAQNLLKTTAPIEELRKDWQSWEGIPVRVTYHPAYIVKFGLKTRAWADLKAVMALLKL